MNIFEPNLTMWGAAHATVPPLWCRRRGAAPGLRAMVPPPRHGAAAMLSESIGLRPRPDMGPPTLMTGIDKKQQKDVTQKQHNTRCILYHRWRNS